MQKQVYPNQSFNESDDEEKANQKVINNEPELKGVAIKYNLF